MSVHFNNRAAGTKRSLARQYTIVGLVALLSLLQFSPAVAQTCPCEFTVSTRDLGRDFFYCRDQSFSGTGYDWAGVRALDLFKGAKGGREPGATKGVLSIQDRAPTSVGDPYVGHHYCESAFGRKRDGTFRKVSRSAISTADEWEACLADLSNIALTAMAAGRDVIGDSCFDSGTGTPDTWEAFPPPPLP